MQNKQFDEDLNETERNAWLSIKRICNDLLRNHKTAKLSQCCAGSVDFIQSYGMQCESENPLSGVTLGFFSQKISAKSVTNTMKDFTKTLWLWKSGTKPNGPQVRWQTIAGQ
jgi:hypothetical protein